MVAECQINRPGDSVGGEMSFETVAFTVTGVAPASIEGKGFESSPIIFEVIVTFSVELVLVMCGNCESETSKLGTRTVRPEP